MRQFKVITVLRSGAQVGVPQRQTLSGAVLDWSISDKELNALADLQVGQTYVDFDGDTWERVE